MKHPFFSLILLLAMASCASNSSNAQRKCSALPNVRVIEQPFSMPGLDRDRQIRIYLPKGYIGSDMSYPVLYMHDGQNLFDDSTSFVGEWGVDESLNILSEEFGLELIVVGIDNGQMLRMNELSPWENKDHGVAEGEAYMDFIINVIKPHIDSTYHTLPESTHTGIMGSSMGGLISHYAIHEHPDIFGMAGIFSPSYWFSEEVFVHTVSHPLPESAKVYMLIGGKEGRMHVENFNRMSSQMIDLEGGRNIVMIIDEEGQHNEAFWQKYFPEAVRHLFKDE